MLRATYGAPGDIDGDPSTLQPSELSTNHGYESDDAAAADDDETRTPGHGRYEDAPQLAPIGALFLLGSRSRYGRTVCFSGSSIQWQN